MQQQHLSSPRRGRSGHVYGQGPGSSTVGGRGRHSKPPLSQQYQPGQTQEQQLLLQPLQQQPAAAPSRLHADSSSHQMQCADHLPVALDSQVDVVMDGGEACDEVFDQEQQPAEVSTHFLDCARRKRTTKARPRLNMQDTCMALLADAPEEQAAPHVPPQLLVPHLAGLQQQHTVLHHHRHHHQQLSDQLQLLVWQQQLQQQQLQQQLQQQHVQHVAQQLLQHAAAQQAAAQQAAVQQELAAMAAAAQQQQQHSSQYPGAVPMQLGSSATSAPPPTQAQEPAAPQQHHHHQPPSPEQLQPVGAASQCTAEAEPVGSCPAEPMAIAAEAQQTTSNGSSGSMGTAASSLQSTDTLKGRPVSPSSPLSDGMF